MNPHATDELAKVANVSASTILKWLRAGFFADCKPARTGDGRTTGAAYRWSPAAMERVQFIVAQRGQGNSMEQILGMLQEKARGGGRGR